MLKYLLAWGFWAGKVVFMLKTKAKVTFDIARCKSCGLCVMACPKGALRMSEGTNQAGNSYAEMFDSEKCTGCGMCFMMCPDLAIEIED